MKEGRSIPTSRKLKIQNIKNKLNLVHLFDHFYLRGVSLEASLPESSVDVNVALHLVFQKGSKKRFNKVTYDILQGKYQQNFSSPVCSVFVLFRSSLTRCSMKTSTGFTLIFGWGRISPALRPRPPLPLAPPHRLPFINMLCTLFSLTSSILPFNCRTSSSISYSERTISWGGRGRTSIHKHKAFWM